MSVIGNEFSGLPIEDLIGGPLKAACDAQVRLATATANFINTVGFSPELDANKKRTGNLVPRQVDFTFWKPLPLKPEVLATGTFTLPGTMKQADTVDIIQVGQFANILAAPPVNFDTSIEKTAQNVASTINNSATNIVNGQRLYLATSSGATITIQAPVGTGASSNGKPVAASGTINGAANTAFAAASFAGGIDGDQEAKVQRVGISVPFLAIINVPSLMIKNVDVTFDMEVKSSESHKDDLSEEVSTDVGVKIDFGIVSADVKIHAAISAHQENTRSTDRSAKYHVDVSARDDGMPEGLSRVLDMLQKAIAPVGIGPAKTLSDAGIANQALAKK
jgi:hypothetical protein